MEWTALPVGIAISTLATMVGLGGGILWTPYFIFAIGVKPSEAVVTSLVIQMAGMGSGALAAALRKKTDIRLPLLMAASALPGVAAGVWLQGFIPPESLVFILGAVCMAAALVFVYAREDYDAAPRSDIQPAAMIPYLWLPPLLSILTGLLSVGVGDYLVPFLRNRLGMRMDAAIGACLLLMAMNATVATVMHVAAGNWVQGRFLPWAIAGVMIGGQLGPRLAHRIPDQTLKEIFIYGLSIIGVHILFNA
jgi:hypothetical protein